MDRPGLIGLLRRFDCGFAMDFSDEYLSQVTVDRLRHIVLAAAMRARDVEGALEPAAIHGQA
jgi:hypothetical protein